VGRVVGVLVLPLLTLLCRDGGVLNLIPKRGDARDMWEMVKFYAFARKDHPRQGKHNALQKGAYFAMPWIAALCVTSGLAIWKPVQLSPLTNFLGGYACARYWHFLTMTAIVVLAVAHVFMVFAVDPYSLRGMITGGYSERLSPEERNARPLINLIPRRPPRPAPAPKDAAG
jgi:thiosulfate reductase cytochrome b subunit